MPFSVSWYTLLEKAEDLPPGATLVTPLSRKRFRITDTQEHRVIIEFDETGDARPLQREQFETLHRHIQEADGRFALDRIPPDAEPYAAVLTLHPRFEIDADAGIIRETDDPTGTQVLDAGESDDETALDAPERADPDLDVYADALLLVDALERHDPTDLTDLETPHLVNLYTLLSDVQRGACPSRLRRGTRHVFATLALGSEGLGLAGAIGRLAMVQPRADAIHIGLRMPVQ